MSSTSEEREPSIVDHELEAEDANGRDAEVASRSDSEEELEPESPRIPDIVLEEERRAEDDALGANGTTFRGYVHTVQDGAGIDEASAASQSPDFGAHESPEGSLLSPDDTPSIQGSIPSSPGSSVPAFLASSPRRYPSGSLQPFDRRFSSRLSVSPLQSPRTPSPAFLNPHSRKSSLISQLGHKDGSETPQAPWEVVRWTKLKKISNQMFSEAGKRNFGRPTCLTIAASIAIGTSKGYVLVFDYHQTLKSIIGPGTKAVECGSVTSLAISADHSTLAGGHATGNIFTWDLAKPAKPYLHIPPIERTQLAERKTDGHVAGTAVLHVGFLGTRNTALVSADDRGMAFSQLASRGLGAVGRTVKTARILGRYPAVDGSKERTRKPSSVLAFSPLPLGNVEQPTDPLGLTALLTPYLLVIVSTTPVAETQHKAARPRAITPHSASSGCLAWFPAVKLKGKPGANEHAVSLTKLVYCWSNILTILNVEAADSAEKDKPPELNFRPRSRWRSEEAIVAVQWLSRSVLAVLTISQRLIILEDNTLRVTDSFDMLHKQILHRDLFSQQLQPVVEQLDEEDSSMHGVVADAFYMSFRTYKGRIFLLGFNDVSIGTLSNWADRLLALMEGGESTAAIILATGYYNGDADKLTVGLPEEDAPRHATVRGKLLDMMTASLRYTFTRVKDPAADTPQGLEVKELAEACFTACISMLELDFLFEEVYDQYEGASAENAFFQVLQPYILDSTISAVPPNVLKDLINCSASQGSADNLEQIICQLETQTMDIDQITTLCKQYNLYDALVYVWNQALADFVTPLIDLLNLIKVIQGDDQDDGATTGYWASAMKLFPYLAYSLTGRVYPSGDPLPDNIEDQAKTDLYGYLFAGKHTAWPRGSRDTFYTGPDDDTASSFPYLRIILKFDTGSFMSMLNEAFEDNFLNGNQSTNGNDVDVKENGDRNAPGLVPTRQYIISILLDVVNAEDFGPEERIYVHMFVARNLPKFRQFLMLPGSALHNTLVGLCQYPSSEIADDAELSVEYLLSMYHPPDLKSLIPLFKRARFYRVLKSVYRSAKDYPKLLETYLDDSDDQEAVFDCIAECLRPGSGLSTRQVNELQTVILHHVKESADISPVRTAQTLSVYAPGLLEQALAAMEDGSHQQYTFLGALLEPKNHGLLESDHLTERVTTGFVERYVQLMCSFNPGHVADYVSLVKSGDLRLDQVLPAMEQSSAVDAAVVLLARDGLVRDGMDRLVRHMGTLESALAGLVYAAGDTPDTGNTEEATEDLLENVQRYCKVGIWLCQGQTRTVEGSRSASGRKPLRRQLSTDPESDLNEDERLWVDLAETMVNTTKTVTTAARERTDAADTTRTIRTLRNAVQQTFTSLLAATSAPAKPTASTPSAPTGPSLTPPSTSRGPSFLHILRAFLHRVSRASPTLSDLRAALADIFAAYAFEETILALATRFLDKDHFGHVAAAHAARQRGWRPRGQACDACKRRVWGPGAGGDVWDRWERTTRAEMRRKARAWQERGGGGEAAREGSRGKGRAAEPETGGEEDGAEGEREEEGGAEGGAEATERDLGPLVVFACRHMFHRRCLEQIQEPNRSDPGGKEPVRFVCPLCP